MNPFDQHVREQLKRNKLFYMFEDGFTYMCITRYHPFKHVLCFIGPEPSIFEQHGKIIAKFRIKLKL